MPCPGKCRLHCAPSRFGTIRMGKSGAGAGLRGRAHRGRASFVGIGRTRRCTGPATQLAAYGQSEGSGRSSVTAGADPAVQVRYPPTPAVAKRCQTCGVAVASLWRPPDIPQEVPALVGPHGIADFELARIACGCHSFPSRRSTTQHPRTCGPAPRQWSRMSASVQPASSRASARIGMRSKARSS